MDFHKIYKPITAAPFIFGKSHREIEPCEALKPYIRCFWGSENSYVEDKADKLVILQTTSWKAIFAVSAICPFSVTAGKAQIKRRNPYLVSGFMPGV